MFSSPVTLPSSPFPAYTLLQSAKQSATGSSCPALRAAVLRKQIDERLVGALLEGFRRVAREQIERLPGTIGELYSFCGHGLTFGDARRRVDIADNRSYISPADD